jgi:hypothetical protein
MALPYEPESSITSTISAIEEAEGKITVTVDVARGPQVLNYLEARNVLLYRTTNPNALTAPPGEDGWIVPVYSNANIYPGELSFKLSDIDVIAGVTYYYFAAAQDYGFRLGPLSNMVSALALPVSDNANWLPFDPSVTCFPGSIPAPVSKRAIFKKDGKKVYYSFNLTWGSSLGSPSGGVVVGLPFDAAPPFFILTASVVRQRIVGFSDVVFDKRTGFLSGKSITLIKDGLFPDATFPMDGGSQGLRATMTYESKD